MLSAARPAKVGKWTEPALRVLRERYLTRKGDEVLETPEEMCWRVAQCLAKAEERWGKSPGAVQEIAAAFYDLMVDGFFLPNSPTLMNAGKGNQLQYSACYVLPVGDSMEEIFDAVKAAAIIHKCLVGDTHVMSNGLTRLRDVQGGTLVMTDEGPFYVSELHDNGEQPVFEVETNRRYSVTGTAEHRLLFVAPDGSYQWRKIGDLRQGDWLVMKPGGWIGGETKLPEFSFVQKSGGNPTSFKAIEHELPRELTPDLAELVGLYIGDGSNHRDGIRITVGLASPDVVRRIEELSLRLFGKAPVVSRYRHAFEVAILSTQIKAWFGFLGISKRSSREARIPEIILRSTEEIACGFVRGLFSADGCIRGNGHITLTTSSRRLGEELQVMLLALGIPTQRRRDVSPKGYESWQISPCTKAGFRAFRERIGFMVERKAARLAAVDDDAIFVKGEKIPNQRLRLRAWYDALPQNARRKAKVAFDDLLNRVKAPRELSRQRVATALANNEVFPPFFRELAAAECFFVQVTAIHDAGIHQVYDLTIPAKHAYLANGFACHNSGGGTGFAFSRLRPKDDLVASTGGKASGPVSFLRVFNGATEAVKQGGTRRGANMGILRVDHPDILEFIECKLDGGITNFNISVAATDRFMEALARGEEYELINPHTGKVVGTLSAREVFERIVSAAWRTGDPGMVFLDRINNSPANPTPGVGMVEATNPCVTGDTLVATPEGWRRVDAIRPGDLILSVKGARPVERVETYYNTPTFRIQFSDGGTLRATAGHQFYVYRENAGFVPIRLDRCRPGDEVQTYHEGVLGSAKILSVEPTRIDTTYDLYEPETDTWITEGYVSRGCGEQPLLPNEACNLGSINVSKFAKRAPNGEWTIDWEELERVVRLSVRFLDNVIEMNPYPLPEIDETVKSNRRIGLGLMGWADLLFIMGIPYDSQEALDLADQLMAFIEEKGHDQSAKLAEERGPFPNWHCSIYKDDRPLRNSTVTTIAPTGTISMIAGCSSGIEPIFALAFEHRVKQPDGERVLTFVNETFERIARDQGFYSEALMQEVVRRGSLHGIPGVPEQAQQVFKTSHEIPYEWHVRHQAAFQKQTDNGVSKCVTGDTLIFTDQGILRIQDLYRGESPDVFSPIQLKVADWAGPVEADLFYFGGKRDVIALETDLGFSLRATPNHRVRVMADGEILWRRMDEIKVRDFLVVPYGFDVYGHLHDFKAIYGAYYRPAERTNATRLQWPYKITTDLARLLGYLIADGGFSENQVIFTQKDDGVLEDYRWIMQKRFGVEPRVSLDLRRENLKQAVVNSRDLIAFFSDYLGTGERADTKHTPRCILASGPEVMKEYVRGLTLDGYVNERGRLVVLGTVSHRLAEEVQAILLNLEIVARLETKGIRYEYRHEENRKEACYEVVVLSKFRRAFLERIGFAEARKNTMARAQLQQQRHPDTHYVVPGVRPLAVSLARAKMAEAFSQKLREYLHSFTTADAEVTEKTIMWLLDITRELKETSEWTTLARLVNRKVMYTSVTKLFSDKEEVFDLEVPSTHSFITNGLISHNTINLPNSATEPDIANAYLLAWDLGCLGITVFRDGCKGEQVLNVGVKGKKEAPARIAAKEPAVIKPRPHSLAGRTYRIETPLGTAFITVNENGDGEPFEVFVSVGKAGSDTMAVAEALGRLISLTLRLPSPLSAKRRLEEVIGQLSRIGGGHPTGFGPTQILSLPDALARVLAEHIGEAKPAEVEAAGNGPKRIGDLCKECGQATFIYEEGCKKCLSCGYNEC